MDVILIAYIVSKFVVVSEGQTRYNAPNFRTLLSVLAFRAPLFNDVFLSFLAFNVTAAIIPGTGTCVTGPVRQLTRTRKHPGRLPALEKLRPLRRRFLGIQKRD